MSLENYIKNNQSKFDDQKMSLNLHKAQQYLDASPPTTSTS